MFQVAEGRRQHWQEWITTGLRAIQVQYGYPRERIVLSGTALSVATLLVDLLVVGFGAGSFFGVSASEANVSSCGGSTAALAGVGHYYRATRNTSAVRVSQGADRTNWDSTFRGDCY
jgi:hypothetical protein